jgi:hypothetical protein
MITIFAVFKPHIEYDDCDYAIRDMSIFDSVHISKLLAEARRMQILSHLLIQYKNIEFDGHREDGDKEYTLDQGVKVQEIVLYQ